MTGWDDQDGFDRTPEEVDELRAAEAAMLEHKQQFEVERRDDAPSRNGHHEAEGNADKPKPNPYRLLPPCELSSKASDPVWLSRLHEGEMAQLFGPGGTCKSFVAFGLAVAVAQGQPFLDRPTMRGPVVVVCGEGHGGVRKRLAAATSVVDVQSPEHAVNTHLRVLNNMPRLMDAEHFSMVRKVLQAFADKHGRDPALLIVDTWARLVAANALEENSNSEVTRLHEQIARLQRDFPRMAVLIVHHSGHGASDRGRGAGALRANCDVDVQAERDGDELRTRLVFHKVKDRPKPRPYVVTFGVATVQDPHPDYADDPECVADGQSLYVNGFEVEAPEQREQAQQRGREAKRDRQVIGDMAAIAVLIAGQPGVTVNDAKRQLSLGARRWSDATAALRDSFGALVPVLGTHRRQHLHLIGANLPPDVLDAVPEGERQKVASAEPPSTDDQPGDASA